ncbi:MAG: ice-binding family protein, partial [Bacteroidota bacterium]
TLNTTLYLDAKGDSNAVFIFQVNGTLSSNTNAKVRLLNGAQSCNVFWKIEGAVTLAVGTAMKGTIVANNGAITLNTNDTLDGRAFSTTGAGIPKGCGSPVLTGPLAPTLASTACYTIFSSNGSVINTGISTVTGDIGSNTGSATGFDSLLVTGEIHETPDPSTATCSSDLTVVFNYLGALPHDIELQSPALFGRDLILTPHTYLLNSATILTDTLYLDAQNNPDGIFVIKIIGALSTSTYSRVKLVNGTQAKNVYWHITGAFSLNDYSVFCGTIVCSGAINLDIGSVLNGRALTTGGAINTVAINAIAPPGCAVPCPVITSEPLPKTVCAGFPVSFSVVATGDSLTYQWRKGSVNLSNGARVSGALSATLTINPTLAADSGDYTVIVSGSCQINDTSVVAALIVNTPPVIVSEPVNQLVCTGSQASFTVSATGTGISYQWRKGNINLSNTGRISGATSATLVINPTLLSDAAANYNVVVSGACAPTDTSAFVSLTFTTAPVITAEPVQQTVCVGAPANFQVTTSGNGLSYQWRKGTTVLGNTGSVSGVNTSTLSINPTVAADAGNYNVIVTGACAPADTSASVALVLNPLPTTPGNISGPAAVCQGQGGYVYTVPVIANAVTYNWTLPAGATITNGATTNTITVSFTASAVNGNLTVQGINSCGSGAASAPFAIGVTPVPANAGAISGPLSACRNQGGLVYSVPPVANATSYNWMVPAGATITSGALTNTITVSFSAVASSGSITVQGINSCGSGLISGTFTVIVTSTAAGNAGSISGDPLVCQGQTGVMYSVAAISDAVTYNWLLPAGASITSGVNTNTITVAFDNSAQSGNITVQGSNGCGTGLISGNFAVTVNSIPQAAASANSPVCIGDTLRLGAATVSGAAYDWTGPNAYTSTDQNPIIANATTTMSGSYSLTVTSNGCVSVPSTVSLVVNACGGTVDVSVIKTVNNTQPLVGQTVVFTLVATNGGNTDATGVIVTDVLRSGYSFVSSSSTDFNPGTGAWTIGNLAAGTSITLTITLRVNDRGDYVNTASVVSNETDSDLVNNSSAAVTYPTVFKIPGGFSPNGDGTNDRFVIAGIEYYPTNTLTVFNRWGDKVYETDSYSNNWNGDSNRGLRVGSNELPAGTYFYVLDLGDGSAAYKGTIYLSK